MYFRVFSASVEVIMYKHGMRVIPPPRFVFLQFLIQVQQELCSCWCILTWPEQPLRHPGLAAALLDHLFLSCLSTPSTTECFPPSAFWSKVSSSGMPCHRLPGGRLTAWPEQNRQQQSLPCKGVLPSAVAHFSPHSPQPSNWLQCRV